MAELGEWVRFDDLHGASRYAGGFEGCRRELAREAYVLFYELDLAPGGSMGAGCDYPALSRFMQQLLPLVEDGQFEGDAAEEGGEKEGGEELRLPCELCGELCDFEDLAEHQQLCMRL
jgi:hypothetical protein